MDTEPEFNPNITQRVIAKAKVELPLWRRAWDTAHKQLTVYYCYLVAISVTLQATIPDLDDYLPVTWRHRIVGCATVIVFLDKLRRSKPAGD